MENFIPIIYAKRRTLTSAQLAQLLDVTPHRLRDNVRYARVIVSEGKHFFKVMGNALRDLQATMQRLDPNHSHASLFNATYSFTLWTKDGVAFQANTLNKPEVYEKLCNEYFVYDSLDCLNLADFGSVRVVMRDGEPWFVAVDICKILDIQDPSTFLANHVDDDEKYTITLSEQMPTNGVTNAPLLQRGYHNANLFDSPALIKNVIPKGTVDNRVNIVNEPGLFRLIFASKKPNAKAFQRKVYHEILPSIHKYGYYSALPVQVAETKPNPELAEKLIALADKMEPCQERQNILVHAANLLVGDNLF